MKDLSIGMIIEKYSPYVISILLLAFLLIYPGIKELEKYQLTLFQKVDLKDLVGVIITLESIFFGFLLTVLALTLQSDAKSIALLKEAGRINELIHYNQQAVISSLVTCIVSLILFLTPSQQPCLLFLLFWFFLIVLSLLLTIRYVVIFFHLIKT